MCGRNTSSILYRSGIDCNLGAVLPPGDPADQPWKFGDRHNDLSVDAESKRLFRYRDRNRK